LDDPPNELHHSEHFFEVLYCTSESPDEKLWAIKHLLIINFSLAEKLIIEGINAPNRILQRGLFNIITEILSTENSENKKSFTQLLIENQQIFRKMVFDKDWTIRAAILRILDTINHPDIIILADEAYKDQIIDVRAVALEILGEKSPQAQDYLIEALGNSNPKMVSTAINIVCKKKIQVPKVILQKLSLTTDPELFLQYIDLLCTHNNQIPGKFRRELRTYLNHENGKVVARILQYFITKSDQAIIPHLSAFLNHPEEEVIQTAIDGVIQFRISSMVQEIIPFLSDSRRNLRRAAVNAIGIFPDSSILPRLIPLLSDGYLEVRTAVYDVLIQHKSPVFLVPLIERLKIALESERPTIMRILDTYSFMELAIPFMQEYRNNREPPDYIITRLNERIPRLAEVRALDNLSIASLIKHLEDAHTAPLAILVLEAWGYKAIEPVKRVIEKLGKDPASNNRIIEQKQNLISQLKQLISRIEQTLTYSTSTGFELLL
jgi:HEAT repeat protein